MRDKIRSLERANENLGAVSMEPAVTRPAGGTILAFQPRYRAKLEGRIRKKREALSAARMEAIESVVHAIDRLRDARNGVDPAKARVLLETLRSALLALKKGAGAGSEMTEGEKDALKDAQLRLEAMAVSLGRGPASLSRR